MKLVHTGEDSNSETRPPFSVGIVMDGNRRWAKGKCLPSLLAHREGGKVLRRVIGWSQELGVTHLVVYAFSTENWNRAEDEVEGLMNIFREVVKEEYENTRITFLGERSRLPKDIQESFAEVEKKTEGKKALHLGIALSYGGRDEILSAIRNIPSDELATLTPETFRTFLWTKEFPDPDLIIRTGREKRLSNFLTWESVYSELFFSDTLWPAFTRDEYSHILDEYKKRDKRFGK